MAWKSSLPNDTSGASKLAFEEALKDDSYKNQNMWLQSSLFLYDQNHKQSVLQFVHEAL